MTIKIIFYWILTTAYLWTIAITIYTYFFIFQHIYISYFLVILCMLCPKSLQLCLIPCDPIDYSPPGSSVYGIHWESGLPCPSSGDLPDPGIEPKFLLSPVLAGRFFTTSVTWASHLRTFLFLASHYIYLVTLT